MVELKEMAMICYTTVCGVSATSKSENVGVGVMHQATLFALPVCLLILLEGAMNCVPVR